MEKIFNEKQVCELYLNGYSTRQIKDKLMYSKTKIIKILNDNNIKIRPKSYWSRIGNNKHTLIFNYFENIDSDEKAYWLGYITADGTISKNNYKISLTSKDLEIIEKFKNSIKTTHPISTVITNDKRTNKIYKRYIIQINSMEFVSHLINIGITNKKSYICNFPNIKKKYIASYLRGLFDGDGSVTKTTEKNFRMQFIGTKEIIEYIQIFLLQYDIEKHPIYSKTKNELYNVYVTNYFKDTLKILKILYKSSTYDTRLNRKYEIYKSMLNKLK